MTKYDHFFYGGGLVFSENIGVIGIVFLSMLILPGCVENDSDNNTSTTDSYSTDSSTTDSSTTDSSTTDSSEVKKIAIEWLDNSGNEDGFIIQRKEENESEYSTVRYLSKGVTNYIDEDNLLAGAYYCYKVVAFNQAGRAPSYETCISTTY